MAPVSGSMARRMVISERSATSRTRVSSVAGSDAPRSQPDQSSATAAAWSAKVLVLSESSTVTAAPSVAPAPMISRSASRPFESKSTRVVSAPLAWPAWLSALSRRCGAAVSWS